MVIFTTYTGNAMLNNALMTIEALANLKSVSEISPSLLKELYEKLALRKINKRLKSYTMVFSLNNPLVNPAKKANNAGENTYHHLINAIINGFESQGEKICEISGLKFNKTFEDFYKEEIERQKRASESKEAQQLVKELKNLDNTDTSLNRSWFPLIGGLGSDAQALPQAKFAVQIHPICISILQFLPLSALLYKGGILLIDSSNFQLSREIIANNTKVLSEKIQTVSTNDSVENIRDFSKGDYLLKVLNILTEKEELEESYSDLNMWSFSNSGTGASCEIDRVPNSLIKKLQRLYKKNNISIELKRILARNESAYRFIESLESNKDWFLLYPNIFGSGKKAIKYEGVSPDFLEAYYNEINKSHLIPTAKYIAGLIERYKSKVFEKLLLKTDAWNDPEYKIELFKVLAEATKNKEWSLEHQVSILDRMDELPIKNNFYQFHKITHYFTQNKIHSNDLPNVNVTDSKVFKSCCWVISLIQKHTRFNTLKSDLSNPNEHLQVGFNRIIIDALAETNINLKDVIEIFYDRDYNLRKYGLNELLRIFFLQPEQQDFDFKDLESQPIVDTLFQNWKQKIKAFAEDYQAYYHTKYKNSETGDFPLKKFGKTVDHLIEDNENFYSLLNEVVLSTNHFLSDKNITQEDKWSIEDLMTNPIGNSNRDVCVLTIKFILKETATNPIKEKAKINENK
ncbi:MAG: hypothetical protein ACO1NW_19225 [Chitinophagaceae bacterium]